MRLPVFRQGTGEAKAHYNVARMLHHVQRDAECKQHLALALKAKADFAPARQYLAELENPSSRKQSPQSVTKSRSTKRRASWAAIRTAKQKTITIGSSKGYALGRRTARQERGHEFLERASG